MARENNHRSTRNSRGLSNTGFVAFLGEGGTLSCPTNCQFVEAVKDLTESQRRREGARKRVPGKSQAREGERKVQHCVYRVSFLGDILKLIVPMVVQLNILKPLNCILKIGESHLNKTTKKIREHVARKLYSFKLHSFELKCWWYIQRQRCSEVGTRNIWHYKSLV